MDIYKIKKYLHSTFIKDVLKLGGGTAIGQAIGVLAMPVITRLYSPGDMGILGLFMSFVGFIGVGVGLRYDIAIISSRDRLEADNLLAASIIIIFPISILSGFILFILIKYNLLSYGELPLWSTYAASLTILTIGLYVILRYWFIKLSEYTILFKSIIGQGVGRAIIPIALGLLNFNWIGLLLGEVGGRLVASGVLVYKILNSLKNSLKNISINNIINVIKINWKYPAIVLPSSLVDSLSAMLPLPIISFYFGLQEAGEFLLIQRLCSLPLGLVATSIADVFHPRITDTYSKSPENIKPLLIKVTKKLILISSFIYIPIAIIAPFIFSLIFGEKWKNTGIIMSVIAPLAMGAMVVSPVSRLLLVVNRMELKLISDGIKLVVPILSLVIMHYFGFTFIICLISYSIMHVLSNLIFFFIIWKASCCSII